MMNAPRLRFKEFSDKFESVTLGKVSDFYKGKGIAKAEISEDGVTPCIRYGELYTKYGVIIEKALSRTNTPKSSLVLSQANDVIIPASGETQVDIATASCVMSSGIALGGDLNIIRSKQNGVFLSYYLNSKKKLDIAKLAQGNSVVHLYASQLRTLELNLPKFEEQKKIATFLSSVDQKITLLTKKYELLIQYKKGVMQKIFNQEIRFKDKAGKYFPEWKTLPLCEVAQIIGGGTPETSVQGNWGGDVQWFTPTELKQKYVSKSVRTITTAGLANSSAKLLPAGTVLFSSRATVGDVAISLNECCTNQGFQSFVMKSGYNNEFLYYWIANNKKLFLEKASGSTFLEISKREIEKLLIQAPCIDEQKRVADFLVSIDLAIELNQHKLDLTKQYKQGLLQQMFI